MVIKIIQGGMRGVLYKIVSLELYFMCIVCLGCGLVSTPPTFEVKKNDLMFLEVPDGVHTFELHWIYSILSF